MKLEYLREFLVLAEELNYSTAARKLYISQSALSKHMALLEEEMGASLMIRSTHYVRLSEAGATAYKTLKGVMRKYDGLKEIMKSYEDRSSGKLGLGLLYYSLDPYFSGFLPDFRKRYPLTQIELKTYQPHELYTDLLEGRIDIGEMPLGDYPGMEQLCIHKTASSGMVAVMREDNPLAGRTSVALSELQQETFIELTGDFCSRIATQSLLKKCGIVFQNVKQTEDIETMAQMVRASGGVHLTGENSKKQASRGLCYVPVSDRGFVTENAFLYRADDPNPLIPLFLREADRYFQEHRS